jgi:dihydrolipoamide dehydrogenase
MSTISNHSDLLVIGAGPGGYEIAAARAALGEKVTIIERDLEGGTCLNRGCIPTKCLCAAARRIAELSNCEQFGVHAECVSTDYSVAASRAREVVDSLRDDVKMALSKCDVVHGEARFTASGEVAVGDELFSADRVIIATGSRPASLNIPGAELAMNSDDFLKLYNLPDDVIVIGGGVIGVEFASIMAAFGVNVTVIEYCPEILPPFDREIAKRLRSLMSRRGVKFVVGAAVNAISEDENHRKTVTYASRKGDVSLSAEMVLMAVGRRPVVPEGLDDAGILTDRRGAIVTDDALQTTRAGVYAVGDCNGRMMLAHAASAQANKIYGTNVNLDICPSAVFSSPEAAMVGLTEEQCAERRVEIRVSKATFAGNGKARADHATDGLVKFISDAATGRILGCHIVGAHASDLIAEAVVAINAGVTLHSLAHDIIHGHPTLSEVVARAAL